MALLDVYIKQFHDFLNRKKDEGVPVSELKALPSPVKYHDSTQGNNSHRVILKGETGVELGAPDTMSAFLILLTDDPALIEDGKIVLMGDDIPKSVGKSVPFGQIICVSLNKMGDVDQWLDDYGKIEECGRIVEEIPGYMIRCMPGRLWARVSKEAAKGGLSLFYVGSRLIDSVRENVTGIKSVSVTFVTSNKEDVEELGRMGEQVRKIVNDLRFSKLSVLSDSEMECENEIDCTSCEESVVCDEIKKVFDVTKGEI